MKIYRINSTRRTLSLQLMILEGKYHHSKYIYKIKGTELVKNSYDLSLVKVSALSET